MTLSWKQWLAIGGACAASTQIGTGLKAVTWLIGVPETAYAAKAKAETVDDQFHEFLTQQAAAIKADQAAADAVNAYIQQQQATPPSNPAVAPTPPYPRGYRGLTDDGKEYCYDANGWWWPNAAGAC